MEQLIAQDLSKRYYHNELTYRDLENLEKQFGIKFDNLISEISFVEKNFNKRLPEMQNQFNSIVEQNTKIVNNQKKFIFKKLHLEILEQNSEKIMKI